MKFAPDGHSHPLLLLYFTPVRYFPLLGIILLLLPCILPFVDSFVVCSYCYPLWIHEYLPSGISPNIEMNTSIIFSPSPFLFPRLHDPSVSSSSLSGETITLWVLKETFPFCLFSFPPFPLSSSRYSPLSLLNKVYRSGMEKFGGWPPLPSTHSVSLSSPSSLFLLASFQAHQCPSNRRQLGNDRIRADPPSLFPFPSFHSYYSDTQKLSLTESIQRISSTFRFISPFPSLSSFSICICCLFSRDSLFDLPL